MFCFLILRFIGLVFDNEVFGLDSVEEGRVKGAFPVVSEWLELVKLLVDVFERAGPDEVVVKPYGNELASGWANVG